MNILLLFVLTTEADNAIMKPNMTIYGNKELESKNEFKSFFKNDHDFLHIYKSIPVELIEQREWLI